MVFTSFASVILGSVALAATLSFATPPQGGGAPVGQEVAGIRCDEMEGQRVHIHQHIAIFDHGKPVGVPDNIGRPLIRQCLSRTPATMRVLGRQLSPFHP